MKSKGQNVNTESELSKKSLWQCVVCGKEFKYESEMKRHARSHDPQFECKVCKKKFSFVSALRRHEKQHDRTGTVLCNKCGSCFKDKNLLQRHIQYAHKETCPCSTCGAVFHSEIALKTHLKKHRPDSERRYRCSFNGCGKAFNFSQHLKHHELTHTKEKLHFCNTCGKGFIQLHHWKVHIKSHNPDSWLSCTVAGCSKKFANDYARKRHIATHKNKLSDSGLLYESNYASDTFTDSKPCALCGKVIASRLYEKHVMNCKQPLQQGNLLMISNTKKDVMIDDNYPFKRKHHVIDVDNGNIVINGCANVTSPTNQRKSKTEEAEINDSVFATSIKYNKNERKDESNNNVTTCESCDCSKSVPMCKNFQKLNDKPLLEYRLDGTVKLKETFDVDIEVPTRINHGLQNEPILKLKDNKSESTKLDKTPYNFTTCKDVLGNCIVSGNGEGCLCAKMCMDDQELTAQEIDEITPYPANSNVWLV